MLGRAYLTAFPEDAGVASLVGLILMANGELDAAAPLLALGCTLDRPLPTVCQHVAVRAHLGGDVDHARALLDKELRFHPTNDAALRAMQLVLSEQGNWTLLVVAVERLIVLRGDSAYLWLVKAQALFNLEDVSGARVALDRASGLRSGWSEVLLLDANLLAAEGQMDRALTRFEEARRAKEGEER